MTASVCEIAADGLGMSSKKPCKEARSTGCCVGSLRPKEAECVVELSTSYDEAAPGDYLVRVLGH